METHWGRYRIRSSRRPAWDYGTVSWYFITICVRDRQRCLAEVRNGTASLTTAGEVVATCWKRIPQIRPGVMLGPWVVMPEHFHALLRPPAPRPSGHAGPGLPANLIPAWRTGMLGVIINQFKRAVTVELKRRGLEWAGWQPRYHDRIVRDESALVAICRYIELNPARYRPQPMRGPPHAGPPGGPADAG